MHLCPAELLISSSCSHVQDAELPPLDEEVLGGNFDPEKAIEAAAASGSPPKSPEGKGKGKGKKGSSSRMENILIDQLLVELSCA